MSSTESPRATLATRAVAMSSLISQPAHQAEHQGDRQQRRQDGQDRPATRLRNARVSMIRMPIADQRNVPHWVAMIASVVRVIRNDRPVR